MNTKIRTYLSAAALAGYGCCNALPAAESPNLCPYGDMEKNQDGKTPTTPVGWSVHTGSATIAADKELKQSGEQSLKISASDKTAFTWIRTDTIVVKPDTTYEISVSTYARGATVPPWCGVNTYESDGGWSQHENGYLMQSADGGAWITKKEKFKTRADTHWLWICLLIGEKNGGSVNLDDVTLREVE